MKLKGYSTLTDEVLDLPTPKDPNEALDLGDMVATGHDNLIVFAEGKLPKLQEWS